jgi:fatty acid synthase subunit beta
LQALTTVFNYLEVEKVVLLSHCSKLSILIINPQLTEKFGLAKVKDMLKDIVNSCYNSALEKQNADGYIVLERGLATIPLAGPDAPFHSRYL